MVSSFLSYTSRKPVSRSSHIYHERDTPLKIGLVAMSGIRVCDEELLRLGLTLPGFVERSKVIASLPSLGLLTLAGMTHSSHDISYIEIADLPKDSIVLERLSGFDLIAISSYSAQIKEAYHLADILRSSHIPVVIGGLHATSLPKEAKRHCDSVVIGEGESVWPQLLRDAEKRRLESYYGSMDVDFDLNEAPMPAFELLDIDKYNRLTVQTSRGCVHQCEFCASSILLTKRYKQKPIHKVLAEIDKIREIWEHPFIEFADDNTFVNKDYWKALLPDLKKRRIRWFAETDISVAQDEKLLTMMRESGCAQVLIGFESPSLEELDAIEIKQNWKAKQFSLYTKAINIIQSHGISVNGCFILGLDNQKFDIFDRIFEFVENSGLHEVQITLQTPFPGTPLYKRLAQENRLIEEGAWEKCTLFDINYIPLNMTVGELSSGFRSLGMRLYSDEFTNVRQHRFMEILREIARTQRNSLAQSRVSVKT
jgi:radical SAM superfamily enzyme YgiQ (UPF0313 family)